VRSQRHQLGGQHPVGAQQRLEAHGRGEVGDEEQPLQVGAGQHQHGQHPVGAVDEGQALLLGQHHGREPGVASACGREQGAARLAPRPPP
jgi:hypothetical protein